MARVFGRFRFGRPFPGYKRGPAEEAAAKPLDLPSAGSFRALAARANFLSPDRPDLGYAAV
eukprot:6539042-Alexandrium_andersonii.AAC.1